jgi:hypothetical protein
MDEPMHFLAAAQSSTSRLGQVPAEFWVKLALGIAILIGVVIVLRKLAKVNKVVLAVIVVLILSFVGFNWIYERNEPAWATPVVQWLANYFPSKGAIKKTSMIGREDFGGACECRVPSAECQILKPLKPDHRP